MRKTTVLFVVFLFAVALFATTFSMPRVQPAATYAVHDVHTQEHLAFGVDPYDTKDKAKIFSVNWAEHGILPVLVVVSNDGDQPATMVNGQFELVLRNREKLQPMREGDLYRAITRIKNPASGPQIGIPLPRPQRAKGGVSEKQQDEIEQAIFKAKAVEPHGSQAGFLFFDVGDDPHPLAGARLYLSGVRDGSGHETMFFEVSFDKSPIPSGAATD
jgi:hypothetical protein